MDAKGYVIRYKKNKYRKYKNIFGNKIDIENVVDHLYSNEREYFHLFTIYEEFIFYDLINFILYLFIKDKNINILLLYDGSKINAKKFFKRKEIDKYIYTSLQKKKRNIIFEDNFLIYLDEYYNRLDLCSLSKLHTKNYIFYNEFDYVFIILGFNFYYYNKHAKYGENRDLATSLKGYEHIVNLSMKPNGKKWTFVLDKGFQYI
ncbi:MAG: hypothetical protein IRZ03_13190 [Acidobacterium ailaaui]|nr:hypothetical protein [Pseudacidobacterium ailaaui]